MRILLVEDNPDLADAVTRRLRRSGHTVDWEQDGLRASGLLEYERFDLVVLDIGLPRLDGIGVLSRMRERGDATPTLMLTARADIEDRVNALDLGADDYLGKPFDFREFEARCRVLLRRPRAQAASVVRIGPLSLDHAARRATLHEQPLELPRREYSLLEILVGQLGEVIDKQELANRLFGFHDVGGPNAVELYVGRLRKRLGHDALRISTVRGVGYLAEAVETPAAHDG
ncbi:response regulator transcription factor [Frateuria defendens]|uniref:response regulator transcription factor n=1 Tax=Frateuria defendens TaxID=2219559 RepID=UPI00066FE30F|nr:response regulator transcription factor [Frateuria defendens]